MKTIRLTENQDVSIFNEKLQTLVGAKLPEAYLLNNDTFGIFQNGEMVAGFVIAKAKSMRCIAIAGSDLFNNLPDYSILELCEANAVWVDDSVKSYRDSLAVWLQVRKKLLRSGCSGVLIPWVASNRGLTRFYEAFLDKVVFRGKPISSVGHGFELKIGFASISSIRWRTLKHVPVIFAKSFFRKRKTRMRKAEQQNPKIESAVPG